MVFRGSSWPGPVSTVLLAMLVCPGCGLLCTFVAGPDDPPGDGFLRLYGEASPLPGLRSLTLTVERVDLVYPDEVRTVAEGPLTIPLSGVGFDVPLLLLDVPAPAGEIAQIRLISAGGVATFEDGDSSVRVPPGETTGLRVIPEAGEKFIIPPDQTLRVRVSIDSQEFLREQGPTDFMIRPVVRGTADFPETVSDFLQPGEQPIHVLRFSLPGLGITVSRAVVRNNLTGAWHEVTVDDDGNLLGMVAVREAERTALRARFGRLAPSLVAELDAFGDDDLVNVSVWLGTEPLPSFRDLDPTAEDFALQAAARLDEMRSLVSDATGAFLPLLDDPAVLAFDVADATPTVAILATKRFVETVLATEPEIVVVRSSSGEGVPLTHQSWRDISFGSTPALVGAGSVPVAIIGEREPGTCPPFTWASDIGVTIAAVQAPGLTTCVAGTRHAEMVVESIGSFLAGGGPTGAFDAPRLVANDTFASDIVDIIDSSTIPTAFAWAVDPAQTGTLPALVGTVSWLKGFPDTANISLGRGVLDDYEVSFDYAVQQYRMFLTRGAGNAGQEFFPGSCIGFEDQCLQTDCDGYNAVCVGGYDFGTLILGDTCPSGGVGFCAFLDDTLASGLGPTGSFLNALNTDRETPEIVAPYFTDASTGSGDIDFAGTSVSSPHAGGLGAQALALEPALMLKPEAVRALLLASSRHNIFGTSAISTYVAPDEADGAGGIVSFFLFDAITQGQWFWGFLHKNADFTDEPVTGLRTYDPFGLITLPPPPGTIRVALAWSSCVNEPTDPSGDSLAAHLDLRVRLLALDGTILQEKISVSFESPYEVVQLVHADPANALFEITIVVQGAPGALDWTSCFPYAAGGAFGDMLRALIGVAYTL